MLRLTVQAVLLGLMLFSAIYLFTRPTSPPLGVIGGPALGSQYSVKLHPVAPEQLPAIQAHIESIFQTRLVDTMSTYHDHSALMAINRSESTDWQPIPRDLFVVLDRALEIYALTEGAFDVTVGPLVRLWGFSGRNATPRKPTDEELTDVLAFVGSDKLQLRRNDRDQIYELRKRHPKLEINVSAIAPGYAADLIADYLNQLNFSNYLIDVGGELFARGVSEQGRSWQVAIEQPLEFEQRVQQVIRLPDGKSAATSGNYRNYVEIEGVRYAHLIDPQTGQPATHGLASVTVIAEETMTADALATGLIVIGLERSIALANQHDIAAFFIHRDDQGGWLTTYSTAFRPFLVD